MLDIAEVSRRSGIPASALRYYEQQGLIASAGRRGLRRLFEPDVLTQLSLISLGQAAGFSLAQIAGMLGGPEASGIDRAQLARQADELDRRIHELTTLRDGLRHVMTCTAPSHLACPTFQRILRIGALRHRAKRRRRAPGRALPE